MPGNVQPTAVKPDATSTQRMPRHHRPKETSRLDEQLEMTIHLSGQDPLTKSLLEACPVQLPDGSGLQGMQVSLRTSELPPWLNWLSAAIDVDSHVHITFSSSLTKQQRARVHKVVQDEFKDELKTLSSGVGDHRFIAVYGKGQVPSNRQFTVEIQRQAEQLFRIARYSTNCQNMSLDEIGECIASGAVPAELQSMWSQLSDDQEKAMAELITAAQSNDVDTIQAIAVSNPGLIARRVPHMSLGELPLQVAARNGCLVAVRALIAGGAPLEAVNMQGHTALQVSRQAEQTDAEALLLQTGAHDAQEHLFPLSVTAANI